MSNMKVSEDPHFSAEELHRFVSEVFQHYNMPEEDAHLAADVLLYSDLRGIDSHGVARLRTYCHFLEAGSINPRPHMKIIRGKGSVGTLDGDNGMGLVIAPRAFEIVMEKAAEFGSGWLAVQNSNHYGAAGYYVEEALGKDMIGLSMTNTSKVVAPLWGVERMLGTNPIAIGFPGKEEPPIVIDFATSTVSFGKVEIQARKNGSLPESWAISKLGQQATRPEEFLDGACLLPLGADKIRGGHKGYGLAAMVDLLCGVLSGANWGPYVPIFATGMADEGKRVGKGIGHFLGAWEIESFRDLDEFKSETDAWIKTIRACKPIPDQAEVLIHGDPERVAMQERETAGIPLIEAVIRDLQEVAKGTGVKFMG